MKVGKEGVICAIAGIERWLALDHERLARELDARLERARDRLQGLDGVTVSLEDDWTSRAFRRVRLDIDRTRAGMSAYQLARRLAAGRPAITVRGLTPIRTFCSSTCGAPTMRPWIWCASASSGRCSRAPPRALQDRRALRMRRLAALERWPLMVRPQRRV